MENMAREFTIKLLNGQIIPIQLYESTPTALYREVYNFLPEEIRPTSIYQLTLSRKKIDGNYEEIFQTMEEKEENISVDELFYETPNELCVMIDPICYEARYGRGYDAYEKNLTEEKDYLFNLEIIYITSFSFGEYGNKIDKTMQSEYYLHHPHTNKYYLTDEVEGEFTGRFDDEFLFSLPSNPVSFSSFSDFLDFMLSQKEYTTRTKQYIKNKLQNHWRNVEEEWKEE